jgi:hypothetical protein
MTTQSSLRWSRFCIYNHVVVNFLLYVNFGLTDYFIQALSSIIQEVISTYVIFILCGPTWYWIISRDITFGRRALSWPERIMRKGVRQRVDWRWSCASSYHHGEDDMVVTRVPEVSHVWQLGESCIDSCRSLIFLRWQPWWSWYFPVVWSSSDKIYTLMILKITFPGMCQL